MSKLSQQLMDRLEAYIGDIDPATKKGQKRRAILEAATQMFAKRGYRKTSMEDLANEVGVAKGTLYLYFPKKFELLAACSAYVKLRWMPQILSILEGDGPAEDRLKQWVRATLVLPMQSPFMLRLMEDAEFAAVLADYPQQELAENVDLLPALMHPLLDEIAGADHPWSEIELRDRVWVIRSISHIAPMLRHEALRPGMSVERFASIFADLIVDGLRPRGQSQGDQAT